MAIQLQQGDTTMFTKTTIALALILGTASGALAATKNHNTDRGPASSAFATATRNPTPAFNAYNSRDLSIGSQRDDSWDVLRHRNVGPSWGG